MTNPQKPKIKSMSHTLFSLHERCSFEYVTVEHTCEFLARNGSRNCLFAQSFLSVAGFVSVDTAAAQALVGESGLKSLGRQLKSLGTRVVKRLPKSAGIRGS